MPQTSTATRPLTQTLEPFDLGNVEDTHDSWLPAPHIILHSETADFKETPELTSHDAGPQESQSVQSAMGSLLVSLLFSFLTGVIGFQFGFLPGLAALFFVIGSLLGHVIGAIETARSYAILKSANKTAAGADS